MNDKIKNLILAAQKEAAKETQANSFAYESLVYEKFAELIVKECVDIIQRESEKAIRNNTYMGDDVPASVTQWKIKEHFGV
jgi:hypothetical protein